MAKTRPIIFKESSLKSTNNNQPHPDPPQGEGVNPIKSLTYLTPLGEGRGGVDYCHSIICNNFFLPANDTFVSSLKIT